MDINKLIQFLRAKKVNSTCYKCGHKSQALMTNENDNNLIEIDISLGYTTSDKSKIEQKAFLMACQNCGHIDLFYKQFIEKMITDYHVDDENNLVATQNEVK